MIITHYQGRLGNILLHNVGASIVSKKFDYKIDVNKYELFNDLNPSFYNGKIEVSNRFVTTYDIFDRGRPNKCFYKPQNNVMTIDELLKLESIDFGIDLYSTSFQQREFLQEYKEEIRNNFNITYEENSEDLAFIHVRLGDSIHTNPGLEFYEKCIQMSRCKGGYISSDTPNHHIVQTIIKKYNFQLYNNNPIKTILFGKNFKKIILSGGTFSWWIGFLSNWMGSSNQLVFYPSLERCINWHGDIFIYDEWIGIQ